MSSLSAADDRHAFQHQRLPNQGCGGIERLKVSISDGADDQRLMHWHPHSA